MKRALAWVLGLVLALEMGMAWWPALPSALGEEGGLSLSQMADKALDLWIDNDFDGAVTLLIKAMESDPDNNGSSVIVLSYMCARLEQDYMESSYLLRAMGFTGDRYVLLKAKAFRDYFQGSYPEAEQAYTQAIEVAPKDQLSDLYMRRGDAYFMLDDFEKALGDMAHALVWDEGNEQAAMGRKLALEGLGRSQPMPDITQLETPLDSPKKEAYAAFWGVEVPAFQAEIIRLQAEYQQAGLPAKGFSGPMLQRNADGQDVVFYSLVPGVQVAVFLTPERQAKFYLLSVAYDSVMYPYTAKLANAFLRAMYGGEAPIAYENLKRARYAKRRGQDLHFQAAGTGDVLKLYFTENAEVLVVALGE